MNEADPPLGTGDNSLAQQLADVLRVNVTGVAGGRGQYTPSRRDDAYQGWSPTLEDGAYWKTFCPEVNADRRELAMMGYVLVTFLMSLCCFEQGSGSSPSGEDEPREALAMACDQGDYDACVAAGDAYARDEADFERAIALYVRGCDEGRARACVGLGGIYESKLLNYFDPLSARTYFERAAVIYQRECDAGNARACGALARLLRDARVTEGGRERELALEASAQGILSDQCERGTTAACQELADLCAELDRQACVLSAQELACDRGHTESCSALGYTYRDGTHGVSRDLSLAAKYLVRACSTGDGMSCEAAAIIYRTGEGVEKDIGRAAALYERACDAGLGRGCWELAGMCEAGKEVPREAARAAQLRRRACDAGYKEACGQP